MNPNDLRIQEGKKLAELIWWTLAKHIVREAGDLYRWDDADWQRAQELFLRNNDYTVHVNLYSS